MDQVDAFELVFGGAVDRSQWDAADETKRLRLVDQHLELAALDDLGDTGQMTRLLQLEVVEQLVSEDPPEVWATAQRLTAAGVERDEVLGQLLMVLMQSLSSALDGAANPQDRHRQLLDQLPLPSSDDIAETMLEVALDESITSSEQLYRRTVTQLGYTPDNEIVLRMAERVGTTIITSYDPGRDPGREPDLDPDL